MTRDTAKDFRQFMDTHEAMYHNGIDALNDAIQSGTTYPEVSIAHTIAASAYQMAILRTIAECQMMQVQQMERIAAALERLAPSVESEARP